ncbi:hypothetical protein [Peribacillus tepidiphilus]|uniref:hypothetical protein n=1 Tax=Peribacillus tepidiphilus TaxID=2652445 RepID=UPI0021F08A49|nr:hypothetical protein [Peribacillus tepidiphilus]
MGKFLMDKLLEMCKKEGNKRFSYFPQKENKIFIRISNYWNESQMLLVCLFK